MSRDAQGLAGQAGTATAMTADWRQAWATALGELELDVASTEALLADTQRERDLPISDPWTPPAGLGPLPLDLRPQADALLARQLAVGLAVVRALATTRRQAAVADRLESGQDVPRPSYVDQAL
jgi:hypothetical protein